MFKIIFTLSKQNILKIYIIKGLFAEKKVNIKTKKKQIKNLFRISDLLK